MSINYVLINGDIVLKEEAKILVTDLSIQRGYGIFDFFKTIDGKPIFLEDHLDRFYFSAAEMFMDIGMEREQLTAQIQRLINVNKLPNSGIRIALTGGYAEDGYTSVKPNMIITQSAFSYDKASFEKGIRLVTYPHQRQLPQIKTIDYLQAIRLQGFIKANNADDVLYHGPSGICECPRSNIFFVTADDAIVTPADNVLQGITRKKILAMEGLNVTTVPIDLAELTNIKEAFITSTTKLALPVVKINGVTIGDGKPGKITRQIFTQLLSMQGL